MRVVTQHDFRRLTSMLTSGFAKRFARHLDPLARELARARVVGDIGPNVVTMNSQVAYADDSDRPSKVTVVYPWDASPANGRVSVLAPLGTALLGAREGEAIEWTNPSGRTHRWRVLSVLFQPEAEGIVHL